MTLEYQQERTEGRGWLLAAGIGSIGYGVAVLLFGGLSAWSTFGLMFAWGGFGGSVEDYAVLGGGVAYVTLMVLVASALIRSGWIVARRAGRRWGVGWRWLSLGRAVSVVAGFAIALLVLGASALGLWSVGILEGVVRYGRGPALGVFELAGIGVTVAALGLGPLAVLYTLRRGVVAITDELPGHGPATWPAAGVAVVGFVVGTMLLIGVAATSVVAVTAGGIDELSVVVRVLLTLVAGLLLLGAAAACCTRRERPGARALLLATLIGVAVIGYEIAWSIARRSGGYADRAAIDALHGIIWAVPPIVLAVVVYRRAGRPADHVDREPLP